MAAQLIQSFGASTRSKAERANGYYLGLDVSVYTTS